MRRRSSWIAFGILCTAACSRWFGPGAPEVRTASEWPSYGNDPGGKRHVPFRQITPENVGRLEVAWEFRTGDKSDGNGKIPSATAFEATPILVRGRLVFCSPFNRVFALDPLTGARFWTFDPEIDMTGKYENQLVCRGVSAWEDRGRSKGEPCRDRIYTGTNDGRLFAIDLETGARCLDFDGDGEIDLNPDAGDQKWKGEYQVTSPPAIIHDLVVVGSAVADNQRLDAPSGVLRAFDARTGKLRWHWDLAPRDFDYESGLVSPAGYALGTPNVWAVMSVDKERGLIFVPTGNPAPDFYRGGHPDMDEFGSSVVALEADSGKVKWAFQTVYHDLWDYDVPAQPALFTLRRNGESIPALAQATKTGHLFILNRETGESVFGIEKRSVPQGAANGEHLSPVQPYPKKPEALAAQELRPEDAYGLTGLGRKRCRELIETMRSEGIFTPPSEEGTVLLPGSGGGLNWSGVAIEEERQILITNATNLAWMVRLFPGSKYPEELAKDPAAEIRPQEGTPFGMRRDFFLAPFKIDLLADLIQVPCNPPPWGTLNAVSLETGDLLWRVNLGSFTVIPKVLEFNVGLPSLGGAIVTASGLAFIAGTVDDYIRAFDVETGDELWRHKLPAGGQATPMSYEVRENGRTRQFVVIAAGGNGRARTKIGDRLVAFALPE